MFENWERETDGQTGERRQRGWNRLAGIRKRQTIESERERERSWDKHTDRQRGRLHAMNSAVYPPPPHLPRLHFLSLTADDSPHPVSASVTSITQGPDTVITVWAPYQTSTLLCVCMCLRVPDWVCDPLAAERMWVCVCLIVCLQFDKQVFLRKVFLTVGLSDKLPSWGKPMD